MGRLVRSYEAGDELPPLVKEMTQEAINLFEGSAGQTGPSQFTDEETARETLGTEGTVRFGQDVPLLRHRNAASALRQRRLQPHRRRRPSVPPSRPPR